MNNKLRSFSVKFLVLILAVLLTLPTGILAYIPNRDAGVELQVDAEDVWGVLEAWSAGEEADRPIKMEEYVLEMDSGPEAYSLDSHLPSILSAMDIGEDEGGLMMQALLDELDGRLYVKSVNVGQSGSALVMVDPVDEDVSFVMVNSGASSQSFSIRMADEEGNLYALQDSYSNVYLSETKIVNQDEMKTYQIAPDARVVELETLEPLVITEAQPAVALSARAADDEEPEESQPEESQPEERQPEESQGSSEPEAEPDSKTEESQGQPEAGGENSQPEDNSEPGSTEGQGSTEESSAPDNGQSQSSAPEGNDDSTGGTETDLGERITVIPQYSVQILWMDDQSEESMVLDGSSVSVRPGMMVLLGSVGVRGAGEGNNGYELHTPAQLGGNKTAELLDNDQSAGKYQVYLSVTSKEESTVTKSEKAVPGNVVIVMDLSLSMYGEKWTQSCLAVTAMAKALIETDKETDNQVALVGYSSSQNWGVFSAGGDNPSCVLLCGFTDDVSKITSVYTDADGSILALDKVRTNTGKLDGIHTNIQAGLYGAKQVLETANNNQDFVVLLTDGEANRYHTTRASEFVEIGDKDGYDPDAGYAALAMANSLEDVVIFTVGLWDKSGNANVAAIENLKEIATDSQFYTGATVDDIVEKFSELGVKMLYTHTETVHHKELTIRDPMSIYVNLLSTEQQIRLQSWNPLVEQWSDVENRDVDYTIKIETGQSEPVIVCHVNSYDDTKEYRLVYQVQVKEEYAGMILHADQSFASKPDAASNPVKDTDGLLLNGITTVVTDLVTDPVEIKVPTGYRTAREADRLDILKRGEQDLNPLEDFTFELRLNDSLENAIALTTGNNGTIGIDANDPRITNLFTSRTQTTLTFGLYETSANDNFNYTRFHTKLATVTVIRTTGMNSVYTMTVVLERGFGKALVLSTSPNDSHVLTVTNDRRVTDDDEEETDEDGRNKIYVNLEKIVRNGDKMPDEDKDKEFTFVFEPITGNYPHVPVSVTAGKSVLVSGLKYGISYRVRETFSDKDYSFESVKIDGEMTDNLIVAIPDTEDQTKPYTIHIVATNLYGDDDGGGREADRLDILKLGEKDLNPLEDFVFELRLNDSRNNVIALTTGRDGMTGIDAKDARIVSHFDRTGANRLTFGLYETSAEGNYNYSRFQNKLATVTVTRTTGANPDYKITIVLEKGYGEDALKLTDGTNDSHLVRVTNDRRVTDKDNEKDGKDEEGRSKIYVSLQKVVDNLSEMPNENQEFTIRFTPTNTNYRTVDATVRVSDGRVLVPGLKYGITYKVSEVKTTGYTNNGFTIGDSTTLVSNPTITIAKPSGHGANDNYTINIVANNHYGDDGGDDGKVQVMLQKLVSYQNNTVSHSNYFNVTFTPIRVHSNGTSYTDLSKEDPTNYSSVTVPVQGTGATVRVVGLKRGVTYLVEEKDTYANYVLSSIRFSNNGGVTGSIANTFQMPNPGANDANVNLTITVTNRYTGGSSGGGGGSSGGGGGRGTTSRGRDTGTVVFYNPEDPQVPLANIPDPETPLANIPEEEVPKSSGYSIETLGVLGAGILFLGVLFKKGSQEHERKQNMIDRHL